MQLPSVVQQELVLVDGGVAAALAVGAELAGAAAAHWAIPSSTAVVVNANFFIERHSEPNFRLFQPIFPPVPMPKQTLNVIFLQKNRNND